MRFCSLWEPAEGRALLCALRDDGRLCELAGGAFTDISQLIGELGALEPAAEHVGRELSLALGEVADAEPEPDRTHLLPPVRPAEVWAAGVTYERSRDARMRESGDEDVYERVYRAERPELFFKATGARVVGPNARIGLRSDSRWQVPEPELGLVLGADGAILGYTLGNDVSSRDIEGENPLYLPQAKIFAGSCALGPTVVSADGIGNPYELEIELMVVRAGETAYADRAATARLHVTLETLASFLARDNWVAPGTVLLTGTGIVPPDGFSLEVGDRVAIVCEPLGRLENVCARAAELAPPPAWSTAPG